MNTFNIEVRNRILVNTGPQRRCYNGCHFSSELIWTSWDVLEYEVPEDKLEDRLKFCKVAQEMGIVGYLRGPSAYSQKSPVQLKSADSKFECDALARREWTSLTRKQHRDIINNEELEYTFQSSSDHY